MAHRVGISTQCSIRALAACYLLLALLAVTSVESRKSSLDRSLRLLDKWLIEKTESSDPQKNMEVALSSLSKEGLFQTSRRRAIRLLANLAGMNHLEQCSDNRFKAVSKIGECFITNENGINWRMETLSLRRLQPILSHYALEALRACESRLESELAQTRHSIRLRKNRIRLTDLLSDEFIEQVGYKGLEALFQASERDSIRRSFTARLADMIAANHNKKTYEVLKEDPALIERDLYQIYLWQLAFPCSSHAHYFGTVLMFGKVGAALDYEEFNERRSIEYRLERSRAMFCKAVVGMEIGSFDYREMQVLIREEFKRRAANK